MDLVDIATEPLQNFLSSLRYYTSPPTPIPCLPALNRGDVIEIQGPAASGKTHLLYHILLTFLLPESDQSTLSADVRGQEIAAVVYDTDLSFDIQRFYNLLLSRVNSLGLPSDAVEGREIARRSLARLHVFRPTSLIQLAASLKHFRAYHASHMPNEEIGVIAIDSISTFYWAERFSAEQMRHVSDNVKNNPRLPSLPSLYHVWNAIQALRLSHSPVIVLTNWALNPLVQDVTVSSAELLYKQHLHPFPVIQDGAAGLGAKVSSDIDRPLSPSPFRLTHHITLAPSGPVSFPPNTPLHVALQEEARCREDIVGMGKVYCLLRSSGIRDMVRFTFQIANDDILVQQSHHGSDRT